jgi:hypothetical protein
MSILTAKDSSNVGDRATNKRQRHSCPRGADVLVEGEKLKHKQIYSASIGALEKKNKEGSRVRVRKAVVKEIQCHLVSKARL